MNIGNQPTHIVHNQHASINPQPLGVQMAAALHRQPLDTQGEVVQGIIPIVYRGDLTVGRDSQRNKAVVASQVPLDEVQ